MSSTAIGTFTCWDGYDGYELVEQPAPTPPRRSRLASTSNLPSPTRQAVDRGSERPKVSKQSTAPAPREHEHTSLDELWNTLREKKQAAEAKLPLKVKSLEQPQPGPSSVSRPTPEQHVTPRKAIPPKVKRKKSTYAVALFRPSVCCPDPSKRVSGIVFHFESLVRAVQYVPLYPRLRDATPSYHRTDHRDL